MAAAINLLGYTGDANLGLGSNPGIPAIEKDTDLSVINQTLRDIAHMSNQRNMQIFRQKVHDRDNLTQLILDERVSTGDILPEYRKQFDEAKKKVEDIFLTEFRGNFNNVEAYTKWANANKDLKDIAANAQVKTKMLRGLEVEKAKETLPRKQKQIEAFIAKQKAKDFWEPVDPYQQMHEFDIAHIEGDVDRVKSSFSDPNNPFNSYDEESVDYQDILLKKRNKYVNDQDFAESVDKFVDQLETQYDPQQLAKTVASMNAKILKYNQQRGLTTDNPKYVKPIETVAQGGRLRIKEPRTDLAAKWALASQPNFVTRTPKLDDKFRADYGLKKQKLQIDLAKLGVEQSKASAYVRHLDSKTKQIEDKLKMEGTNIVKQYTDFINNMKVRGTTTRVGGKQIGQTDAVFLDQLPEGYQFIGGPIVDAKGKISVGKLTPFMTTDKTPRPYYKTRYVDTITGETIDLDNLPKELNEGYKLTIQRKNITKEDYIKGLLKKGELELILQGTNGASNYTSMYQSAKTINAIGTTKGEDNIVNPPQEIPQDEE